VDTSSQLHTRGESVTRLLLIVDDPGERACTVRRLTDALSEEYLLVSTPGDTCTVEMREHPPDVVLLRDDTTALERLDHVLALLELHVETPVPIVMVAETDDERRALAALRHGAEDHVGLDRLDELDRRLRAAIERGGHRARARSDADDAELESRFLSHVSHELRSPLTAIYQFLTLVSDGVAGPTNPEQDEYLATALRSVERLERLIDELVETTGEARDDDRSGGRAA
jgi:signal transduction histidine kinase